MKLDIHNSKRKNAADDRMTDQDITDRFEDDVAKEEGDWGKADKKYAPGPTYEEEMDQLLKAILTEAKSFSPKHTDLDLTACSVCGVKGHVPAKHFGKALSAENNQTVKEAWTHPYTKAHYQAGAALGADSGGYVSHTELQKHTKLSPAATTKLLGHLQRDGHINKRASMQESSPVEPKVIGHFIQKHLPSGKEHKGAMMDTHLRELGSNGRLSTGEKVTKDHILNHWNAQQPKTYQYRWMKEGEEDGPMKKCPECGKAHAVNAPCAAKKLLFSTEEEKHVKCIKCKQPFSYTPKDKVEMQQVCPSCIKKLKPVTEGKKQKKFDKTAHIKAIARNTVGQVPKGQVIVPKDQRKKPKHKVDWRKSLDEAVEASTASAHEAAAKLHDQAAAHSKGDSRMIDRPYKDACDASYRTRHAGISKMIQHGTNGRQGGYTPDFGSRHAFHTKLAQMHRDAAKE
jgi:transcription initiation factor IIE alpha subunit